MQSSALVPVQASEMANRAHRQRSQIEDKVALTLIEVINQGVRECASQGLFEYEFKVPAFIYGFPCFDTRYVLDKLSVAYREAGFHVKPQPHKKSTLLYWGPKPTTPSQNKESDPKRRHRSAQAQAQAQAAQRTGGAARPAPPPTRPTTSRATW